MAKQYKVVHCTINGKQVEKVVDVRASLTDMLRNDFRLTSVKKDLTHILITNTYISRLYGQKEKKSGLWKV